MRIPSFLAVVLAVACLLAPLPAAAADKTDVYVALWTMRGVRMALTQVQQNTDKKIVEAMMKEVGKASNNITKVVDAALKDTKDPDAKGRLESFKTIWDEFQKTREEEVFPAILAGQMEKARQIEMTIQLGRFRRMNLLVQP